MLGALEVVKATCRLGDMKMFEYVVGSVLRANSTRMLWAHPNGKHGGRGQPVLDWARLNHFSILTKATGRKLPLQVQELLFPFSRSFPFPIDTQHPASAGSRYFSLLGICLLYPPIIPSGLLGPLSEGLDP